MPNIAEVPLPIPNNSKEHNAQNNSEEYSNKVEATFFIGGGRRPTLATLPDISEFGAGNVPVNLIKEDQEVYANTPETVSENRLHPEQEIYENNTQKGIFLSPSFVDEQEVYMNMSGNTETQSNVTGKENSDLPSQEQTTYMNSKMVNENKKELIYQNRSDLKIPTNYNDNVVLPPSALHHATAKRGYVNIPETDILPGYDTEQVEYANGSLENLINNKEHAYQENGEDNVENKLPHRHLDITPPPPLPHKCNKSILNQLKNEFGGYSNNENDYLESENDSVHMRMDSIRKKGIVEPRTS